jgi:ribonuclease-3
LGSSISKFIKKIFLRSSVPQNCSTLQSQIGYQFSDIALLTEALTHRSYKAQSKERSFSNERLEFLGDSVLGLVVAKFLYENFPSKTEGELTKLKAMLVSENSLVRTAKQIGLGQFINMSPEEEKSGGRKRPSILSDAYEALIGAVFLDGGLEAAEDIIETQILGKFFELITDKKYHNYKGELLEYLQGRGEGMPKYKVMVEEGPEHKKEFTVAVFSQGKELGTGKGKSKKEAEQKAAKMALETIHQLPNESSLNQRDNL